MFTRVIGETASFQPFTYEDDDTSKGARAAEFENRKKQEFFWKTTNLYRPPVATYLSSYGSPSHFS